MPSSPNPSRFVVTGAAGFIGRALVEHLARLGMNVVGVDRRPSKSSDWPCYQRNLAQRGAFDDLLDSETVLFHLAARASVPDSVADPRADFADTLGGVFEALEATRRQRCRVIFPSTASIFDPSNTLPLGECAYVRPTSPYAAAKVSGEAYCHAYHRSYGIDVRIARMFSVYGVGMSRFVIHDLIRKIQSDPDQLDLLGDGNQIRDYLYIDDAVRGLLWIATRGQAGEDYNLASGIPVRIADLAAQVAALMGRHALRVVPTGRSFPGDVAQWYADVSKLRALGFSPEISLKDGLRRTIAWLEP